MRLINNSNIIFFFFFFVFFFIYCSINCDLIAQPKYQPTRFNVTVSYKGTGGMGNAVIGTDNKGIEYLYSTHSSIPLQVIATNLYTGESTVFNSQYKAEAYALVIGPDKKLYVGTSPNGHLHRINWENGTLDDLGIAIKGEEFILKMTVGSDGNIYGCTSPNAKLFRYNIIRNKFEDLGRMDANEMYAHSIESDKNGFIYIGIGYSKCHLMAYEIATGKYKDILPDECKVHGYCWISKGKDGKLYAAAGNNNCFLTLNKWKANIINENTFIEAKDNLKQKNGNKVEVDYTAQSLKIYDSKNQLVRKLNITNNNPAKLHVFRIGTGPDGNLYGGTELPFNFFKLDLKTNRFTNIAKLGEGEGYSYLSFDNKLMILTYTSLAPIMIYDPDKVYNPLYNKDGNPHLIVPPLINYTWRPFAAIMNKNKKIYIGSMNEYGKEGGALTVFNPKDYKINVFENVMGNQSVFSLCNLPDGILLGGTYIQGGLGSKITEKEAKIFIWDTKNNKKTFEIVPVSGQQLVNAIITGNNDWIYGFAGDYFFVFDPKIKRIIKSEKHGLGYIICNALGITDKNIYGVSSNYVFRINQKKHTTEILSKYEKPITGGFALTKNKIYFVCESEIVSYDIH